MWTIGKRIYYVTKWTKLKTDMQMTQIPEMYIYLNVKDKEEK